MSPVLRDYRQEFAQYRVRLSLLAGLFVLAFFVLASRLFYLQVVEHNRFLTLAEKNRIAILPIPPGRGIIFDRNGTVLAHNFSTYTLEVVPDKVEDLDATLNALSSVVEISPRDRRRFEKYLDESKQFESAPIRTHLNDDEVARFAVNAYRFPGIEVKARLFRNYPLGQSGAHAIGYIGRINERDIETLDQAGVLPNYRGTDHMGKAGIEQSYESKLHGTTGLEEVETDAGGRLVRVLSQKPPVSGANLYLTIDSNLQRKAEEAFGDRRGSLVAIDPTNGEVLAMVSQPSFDPNLFVDGIDTATWNELNNSPDHPLNNRAIRGQYPPGSTIKPFMALVGLATGKRTPSWTINDPGYYSLPNSRHRYRDWRPGGHGRVDLFKSIVVSCDTYYYSLAVDLGIDTMHQFLSRFGFSHSTGIDLQGELPGVIPSREWKLKRFHKPWLAGETVIAGIGQGYDLATPLQLAQATAVLANNGQGFRPHLVREIQAPGRETKDLQPEPPLPALQFTAEQLGVVRSAMIAVLQPGGTAARAGAGARYAIAGKTGTAQVIGVKQSERYVESRVQERHRDHALFIAYAPAEAPRIAVAVIVENGGHGGSSAAPIARQLMDFYLVKETTPEAVLQGEDTVDEHD